MSQAAPITVASGDTKSIPGDYSDSQYDDVTIEESGTLNATAMIDNRGTVTNNGVMNNSSFMLILNQQAISIFNNNGRMSNDNITVYNSNTAAWNNNGTMDNTMSTIYSQPSATFNNDGTINNTSGTTIYNQATSTFNNRGTLNNTYSSFENDGSLTNSSTATINHNNGTLNNEGGGSINILSGGTLNNNNTVNILGFMTTNSGSKTNNLGLWTNGDTTNQGFLTNKGEFVNEGTLTHTNGFFNNQGALLTNSAVGRIINRSNLSLFSEFSTPATLNNEGSIINDIGGNIDIRSTINNNASMINSSVLSNGSPFDPSNIGHFNNTNTFLNEGILNNTHTLTNTATLTNRGNWVNGDTITNARLGRATNDGSIYNEGTITNVDDFVNNVTLLNTATFSNRGTLTNVGSFDNQGTLNNTGSLNNSGDLVNNGSTSLISIGTGGTSGTLDGNVANNGGRIVFSRSNAVTYAGTISGNGSLEQAGSGKLTLNANHNAFTGPTTVTTGGLGVTGTLNNSQVTVKNGASLSGTGSINSAVFEAGSTYMTRIAPVGTSEYLTVNNTTSLTHARLLINADTGTYPIGTTYTILEGSIPNNTTFNSVALIGAPLNYKLDYSYGPTGRIQLTIKLASIPTSTVSGNANTVAGYLNTYAPLPLKNTLSNLDPSQLTQALNELSPRTEVPRTTMTSHQSLAIWRLFSTGLGWIG